MKVDYNKNLDNPKIPAFLVVSINVRLDTSLFL